MDIPTIQQKIEEIAKNKLAKDLLDLHTSFLQHQFYKAFDDIKISLDGTTMVSVKWLFGEHVTGSIYAEVFKKMMPVYVQKEIDDLLTAINNDNFFDETH